MFMNFRNSVVICLYFNIQKICFICLNFGFLNNIKKIHSSILEKVFDTNIRYDYEH